LTSKIVLSFQEDSLSLKKIDSLLANELQRKNIAIDYGLTYTNPINKKKELRSDIIKVSKLETSSKSPYFMDKSSLKIHFSNITQTILKKNIFGIFLSFLLVAAVIGCLLYLLGIIKHQKQLAEVKNDLISNITHEFKTPIATIGAAMEGIQTFNTSNDIGKNLRYAKISSEQVEKLNGMVEKLLETATLDSEKLPLNFEEVNLVELLRKASFKEAFASENKTITFETSLDEINYAIDIFHFENAINNIIDNAIKYGGEKITVGIQKRTNEIEILISDSGSELSEEHKKHIFEKFYRVPKGNTHDVKGFGIGLYYSKKIIEKHKGTITLEQNHLTSFKISLPNV
jgi:two-component system phosphate regulon sensor histidine kinase PhoR